ALRLELVLRSSGGVETQFGGWGKTHTDRDGYFRYDGVGEGAYVLVPESPSDTWVGRVHPVHAGTGDLRLVVASAADDALLHLEAEWIDAESNAPVRASEGTVILPP